MNWGGEDYLVLSLAEHSKDVLWIPQGLRISQALRNVQALRFEGLEMGFPQGLRFPHGLRNPQALWIP
jgi:hypothetical protein